MARGYIPVDRAQQFLLPPDMREWLPEDHLVWWLVDLVDRLDTSVLHRARRRGAQGRAGYDPDMLLGLLIYAYCHKVRSSRQIERLCVTDVAFRVLCGGLVPDHTTIARFRQDYDRAARELFVQVLEVCAAAGFARVGLVAVDGTKIAADASIDANRTRRQLNDEVAAMFAEAASTDGAENARHGDRRGDEPPAGGRKARLDAAFAELDRRDAGRSGHAPVPSGNWETRIEAANEALDAARGEWADRKQRQAAGTLRRGRATHPEGVKVKKALDRLNKLQARAAKARRAEADTPTKVNVVDPDSRIMVGPKGWIQGYNAQAAINDIGIIVAVGVTDQANDIGQFIPMLERLASHETITGPVGVVLADAGYCSTANLTAPGPVRLIATANTYKTKHAHKPTATTGPLAKMRHTLATPEGKALYAQRSVTVEPGFGNLKANLGFTRFSRRGHTAANAEWHLIATVANLLKLHRWHPAAITAA